MFLPDDSYCPTQPDAAVRIKRKSMMQFRLGLRDPSLWLVSPKSLYHHDEHHNTPLFGRPTEFGVNIREMIHRRMFTYIKYGRNAQGVIDTTEALERPCREHCQPGLPWTWTRAFTLQEVTRDTAYEDFLPPCQEKVARCIDEEFKTLKPRQACLVLVSDEILEGLLDEAGTPPRHYVHNIVITYNSTTGDIGVYV
jgi:hypothetical protein